MDKNKIYPLLKAEFRLNYASRNSTGPGGPSKWGPREIEDYELILVQKGRFYYTEHSESERSLPSETRRKDGSLTLEAGPGDLLVIPPGTLHSFGALTKQGEYVFIHHQLLNRGGPGNPLDGLDPPVRYISSFREDYSDILHSFRTIIKLRCSYQPLKDELIENLCRNIWLNCLQVWTAEAGNTTLSPRMESMLAHIRGNCDSPLDRQELGRIFKLTPEYINALFKKELGMSPGECIKKERIFRAYALIYNEGCSVKEAAFRSGFNDPFYFSRVFKKITGINPRALKGREYFNG